MSKHTPGNWTCRVDQGRWGWYFIPEIRQKLEGEWKNTRLWEDDANAKLIAAAPDLLEVAELLLTHALEGGMFNYPAGSLQMLEKAVAKAKGLGE